MINGHFLGEETHYMLWGEWRMVHITCCEGKWRMLHLRLQWDISTLSEGSPPVGRGPVCKNVLPKWYQITLRAYEHQFRDLPHVLKVNYGSFSSKFSFYFYLIIENPSEQVQNGTSLSKCDTHFESEVMFYIFFFLLMAFHSINPLDWI